MSVEKLTRERLAVEGFRQAASLAGLKAVRLKELERPTAATPIGVRFQTTALGGAK